MKNFAIFADSLDFIEEHLCTPMTQEEIADACYCSLSHLQKIWRYCANTSLKEYISRRRLTCSAREILDKEQNITEIAYRYQYNSPEVFTRAFQAVWGVSPSKFRSEWKFSGIFPKMVPDETTLNYGGSIMQRKHVDVSELYDELMSRKGSYVLCFDISHLTPINAEYGHKAGDRVILEGLRRVDEATSEDMMMFRIGGDEFVVVTNYKSKEEVNAFCDGLLKQNGNTIEYEGAQLPVSLRIGAMMLPSGAGAMHFYEIFDNIQDVINNSPSTEVYFV